MKKKIAGVFLPLILSIFLASCKTQEKQDAAGVDSETDARPAGVEHLTPIQKYDRTIAVRPEDAEDRAYTLKKGDKLEITVLDEPEMNREVFVLPDGSINYLLVGRVKAAGKSPEELAQIISKGLSAYLKNPQVSVIIKNIEPDEESQLVSVVGAVQKPGKIRIRKGDRLLDIITEAGGLLYINDIWGGRSVANLNSSYISRNGVKLDVNIDKLMREGDMSQNILIQPGDFVYFPESDTSNIVVLGEVETPNIIPFTREISLIEAISRCGGFTKQAQKGTVIVLRPSEGETLMRKVDIEAVLNGREKMINLALKAGDIVFVPEQGLSEYERYAQYLTTFANLILQGYQVREQIRFPRIHRRDNYYY